MEHLEVRDCPFGEGGFAIIVVALSSLKYLWVSETWAQLLALFRPCLHIEVYLGALGQPRQLLAYYALIVPLRQKCLSQTHTIINKTYFRVFYNLPLSS